MSETDNLIQPFHLNGREIRGRLVRLGGVAHDIISRHELAPAPAALLGEALALASMTGSALNFDGIFTLQTEGNGPAGLIVCDYRNRGNLRGYVRLKEDVADRGSLLGKGYMSLTIDREEDDQRYQGVVDLQGDDLSGCVEHYFRQSEQVPTLVRAVCGHGPDGRWRAGGILLQSLPRDPDEDKAAEDWNTAEHLARTIKPQELLDISLPPRDLLFRLFHEDGVWAHDAEPLIDQCTCTADRVVEVVQRFPRAEVAELIDESGKVTVTCKFCSRSYGFQPEELTGDD